MDSVSSPLPSSTHTSNNFVYSFRELTNLLNMHRPSTDLRLRTPPPIPQRLVFMKEMKWFSPWVRPLHCTSRLKPFTAPHCLWNQVLTPKNGIEKSPPRSIWLPHLSSHFTSQNVLSSLYTIVILKHSQFSSLTELFLLSTVLMRSHPLCQEHSSPAPPCQVNTHSFWAQLRCPFFRESPLTSQGCSVSSSVLP